MSVMDHITGSLYAAPELGQTPGLALGVAQASAGYDPADLAQMTALSSQMLQMQQTADTQAAADDGKSADDNSVLGTVMHFFGSAANDVKSAVGDSLHMLNWPLQQVTHIYRYMHTTFAKGDYFHGFLALGGGLAGGVIGGLAGGLPGATLGAELGSGLTALSDTKDWDASANSEVSIGRDAASWIGGQHGTGFRHDAFSVFSGIVDGTFDWFADPLATGAKGVSNLDRYGRFGHVGAEATLVTRAAQKLGASESTLSAMARARTGPAYLTGRVFNDAGDYSQAAIMDVVQKRRDVARAFDMLKGMNAGEVVQRYGNAFGLRLAKKIGDATDHEGIAKALSEEVGKDGQWTNGAVSGIPRLGLTRKAFSGLNAKIYDKLSDTDRVINYVDKDGNAVALPSLTALGRAYNTFQSYRPLVMDPETLELSGQKFDPENPYSVKAVGQVLRFSQSPSNAAQILNSYIHGDVGQRVAIYKNALGAALRGTGADPTLMEKFLAKAAGFDHASVAAYYGTDVAGHDLSRLAMKDRNASAPILSSQIGSLTFPDFQALRNVVRVSGNKFWRGFGRLDQFAADYFMNPFFKPLALMTGGFALRVATGELIPGLMEHGPVKVAKAGTTAVAARFAPERYDAEFANQVKFTMEATAKRKAEADQYHADLKSWRDGGKQGATPTAPETLPTGVTTLAEAAKKGKITAVHPALRPLTDDEIATAGRNMGLSPDGVERGHIRAAFSTSMHWATNNLLGRPAAWLSHKLIDDDYRDVALHVLMRHEGHIVPPALGGGYHVPELDDPQTAKDMTMYRAGQDARTVAYSDAHQFQLIPASQRGYEGYWAKAINQFVDAREMQPVAKAYLEAFARNGDVDEATLAAMKAHKDYVAANPKHMQMMSRQTADTPDNWARVATEALKGITHGNGGETFHRDIMQAIANGKQVKTADLQNIPLSQRPNAIPGAVREPYVLAGWQKLVTTGFNRILHPIVNTLSREPLYIAAVTREYKFLKPLVESHGMSVDDALKIAETRGVLNTLPLIHNPQLRSQFSDVFRNVMPFYFAQEQAVRRYGSAIARNPADWGRFATVQHALTDGMVRTDDTGQKHLVLPLGGAADTVAMHVLSALGMPVQAGVSSSYLGNITSFKSIIPEAEIPSLSPLVAVPMKWLESVAPGVTPATSAVLGDTAENQSAWATIIPNTVLHGLVTAFVADLEGSRAFGSAVMSAAAQMGTKANELRAQAQEAAAGGDTAKAAALLNEAKTYAPEEGDERAQRAFVDKLKTTARSLFVMKAFIAAFSPAAPQLQVGDVQLRDELRADIKSAKGNWAEGITAFLEKHPNAGPDTLFYSHAANNATLPTPTDQSLQWLGQHQNFVKDFGLAAAYLIPTDGGKYNAAAYNEELNLRLRERRSPEEFLHEMYVAADSKPYFDALKAYQDQSDTLTGAAKRAASTEWQQFETLYFAQHPEFAADLKSGDRQVKAQQALQQLANVLDSGKAPEGSRTAATAALLSEYRDFEQRYRDATMLRNTHRAKELRDAWSARLDEAKQDPLLAGVATGIFGRLPTPTSVYDPYFSTS